jgi:hypothetical protein
MSENIRLETCDPPPGGAQATPFHERLVQGMTIMPVKT